MKISEAWVRTLGKWVKWTMRIAPICIVLGIIYFVAFKLRYFTNTSMVLWLLDTGVRLFGLLIAILFFIILFSAAFSLLRSILGKEKADAIRNTAASLYEAPSIPIFKAWDEILAEAKGQRIKK
ncbi:MAG: hypothetical protein WC449_01900 [Candidatus Paceibacterota bacterium]